MLARILVVLTAAGLSASLDAANFTLKTLTDGSVTYSNVTIIGANATDLYFTHARGIGNIKLKYLDPSLQKRFNYDEKLAAEAEKQQINDDSRFYQQLTSNLVNEALKSATLTRKAASSSADSLSDPISEKSFLGKKAPPLTVEKWIGAEPALQGKAVLIVFWAPWSIPSRRYLPFLNELSKKFSGRLTVVGLSNDTEAEIAALESLRPEFPCAIDPQSRLASTLGITSVPSVVLMDAKGIVYYQGHPAALEERLVEQRLPKAAE